MTKEDIKITILPKPERRKKFITTFYVSKETNSLLKKAMKKYKMTKDDLLNYILKQV